MSWFETRTKLEEVTHRVFPEPATYTAPGGGPARAVVGILSQKSDDELATSELGYEARVTTYEIRKAAVEGPWTADYFAEQGQLVLDSGAAYVVVYVTQTDTLITLGLAAVE